MNVTPVTEAADVRKRLLKLIKECKSFRWATAWAGESDVFDAAIASNKMSHIVIGTHQYFTAPAVLDKCLGIRKIKVMPPKGRMFHPKVYAFDLGGRVEIFVGSSNLTMGGLARNIECGVFLNDESSSESLQDLLLHVAALWGKATELDADFIASYKANYRRVKLAKEALEDFIEIKKPTRPSRTGNKIPPQEMDWPTFLVLVKGDKTHGLDQRLRVLFAARQIFSRTRTFGDLEEVEQKCIAGILKPSKRNDVDWAFFGQMSAFGRFSPSLQTNAKLFSKALDCIPLQGNITREHYDAYLSSFKKIPGASETWTGMGTRLIAMKRPDYFVCLDNANRNELCSRFGVAPTTTNLDNYWDRIISPMMMAPWWGSDMPINNTDQEIWMGRAAMLDAIYYDPKKR